jgi:hypothetical protein
MSSASAPYRAQMGVEIDAEVAHDALDDFRTQQVVLRQGIALDRREFAVGNRLAISAGIDFVLDIALRQMPDGAGTETEQDAAAICGVALKIPAKTAFALGNGHRIARSREVIEPDLQISGIRQCAGDYIGLPKPVQTVGQATFLDLALMLPERRHMRVAEHRETIPPEREAQKPVKRVLVVISYSATQ